jgi:tRNA (adenine37-N6)-methyltransferase
MPEARGLMCTPIGVVRSPWRELAEAPRQPPVAAGVEARIELHRGFSFEDALRDLEGWDWLWVLFWFDRARGWKPTVQPPRSKTRRGLFATRSPHRPNPIGLSLVRLVRVEGLVVHIRDVDMVDGTPVLDLKPYIPYAESKPGARTGWLEAPASHDPSVDAPVGEAQLGEVDPAPRFAVRWSDEASERAAWVEASQGLPLRARADAALALGPQPHAYRRIKREGATSVLAVKEWRVRFAVLGERIEVVGVESGYRDAQLDGRERAPAHAPLEVHRAFRARFPAR